VDFNEERLEKRFRRTMETLSKNPRKSIYGSSANRAEAKAIYNLLDNEKFDKSEIMKAHRAATIRRMEGHPVILAVQDTTSVNYDTHQKMEGNGYISDKTMGVNIHSCLAVTPEGLVLGMLEPVQNLLNNSEFGRICGVKRRKPGFSLQSFGCAKRISASIPCAPGGGQDIKQALRPEGIQPGRKEKHRADTGAAKEPADRGKGEQPLACDNAKAV
jgi:hypothetical protein